MIYRKDQIVKAPKLPDAPEGIHPMICTYEGPSKTNPQMHSFLFKSNDYQIWYNCFKSKLYDFAEKIGVEPEANGDIHTDKFINRSGNVVVSDQAAKDGNIYKRATDFQNFKIADPIDDINF